MQKRTDFKRKLVASLIVFILLFSNFATLGSSLISLAAENSDDRITYSAQFVMISNTEESEPNKNQTQEPNKTDETEEEKSQSERITAPENSILSRIDDITSGELQSNLVDEVGNITNPSNTTTSDIDENEDEITIENSTNIINESGEQEEQEKQEQPEDALPEGLALEITLGVKTKGYLKNAKVDIKDLSNQIFKIRDDVTLGEYVQSIEDGKIRLKQINGGTEVSIYIPIELKEEETVDVKKLQSGVELSMLGTIVSEEGEEEIITRSVKPVLPISNDMELRLQSNIEKFIPYIKDGKVESLVQLKVTLGTDTEAQLPVKDTQIQIQIPEVDGATIKDVNVSAISTGYTNGLLNGDVIFTVENWDYQNGLVTINVNNPEKDGRYQKSTGDDIYVISYKYENIDLEENEKISSSINARVNAFTSTGENEIQTSTQNEYDLSQANSNIVTYNVTRKTQEFSKGYLYANANADETAYIVEYDNAFDVNISRPDLVQAIQINEGTEYFVDNQNIGYPTSTETAENTYYEKIRLNKENLDSIIGEEGDFEILLENGMSLIKINKDTEDDGDGYITINFGENKIGKILMRINNPSGEGILNIVATKAIADVTFEKIDFEMFKAIQEDFTAVAQLQEGIITEMGTETVATDLLETKTNAVLTLSRNELSTLVENEDVEINIALNNATEKSDMYKNPVFELLFPKEVEDITITDINLLYGNDELEIANVETIRDDENRVVLRITLNGVQSRYTMGESENGTTIILKSNIKVDMYSGSRQRAVQMKYYNEDATNYEESENWQMLSDISSYMLIPDQGKYDANLNIVAPEGFVNAQMISNYKDDAKVMSIDQGLKQDTIKTFVDAREAQMRLILINNTDEDLTEAHILGRTIFEGNKSIINKEELGTNKTAPMTSDIQAENSNYSQVIYYSENEEATEDLQDSQNAWTQNPESFENIKSYLIVINGPVLSGDVLGYTYNFEIPEKLGNNIDLAGTYATYYTGTKTKGVIEPDKVMLTTGDAPVLKVETVSDSDEAGLVEGQLVTYTVKVTNEGRSISTGTVVNSLIPAGTTYIENGILNPDVTELNIELGDIRPGRTAEASYQVKVDTQAQNQEYIEVAGNVEADGLEEPIYTEIPQTPIETAEVEITIDNIRAGQVVEQDLDLWYTINVDNLVGENYQDCTIKMTLPEGLRYNEAYIIGMTEAGDETSAGNANYNEGTREITWHIDNLEDGVSLKVKTTTTNIGEAQKDLIATATITSPNLKRSYTSTEVKNILAKPVIEYTYKSNSNNQFIKEGDYIDYILDIKNTGLVGNENIKIANSVPENFKVIGANVIKAESANSIIPSQDAEFNVSLNAGEEAQIVLNCVARNLDDVSNDVVTQNNWEISGKGMDTIKTSSVRNIVQQNYEMSNYMPPVNQSSQVVQNEEQPAEEVQVSQEELVAPLTVNEVTKTEENTNTYRIMGTAFSDLNNNGAFDNDEEGMTNIVAKLCDAKTQKIVAQTVTNNEGKYLFDQIVPGEYYVKYEYDNTKYTLSEYKKQGIEASKNSDAIISNYKAVTDKIVIKDTSISDINIGLVRAGIFDLDLDVNVNRITVQDEEETKNFEMENSKLGKVDINPKYADSSKVFVEYTIDVSNKGEIAGYVKRIADYLPKELEFDAELNQNWYLSGDGNLYTDELEDTIINPGETKTLKLVLTKQMTENSTGLINNTFEIAKSYNQYAIEDIDSMAGNKAEGEDDMSRADIIIGVQTGGNAINVMIITTTLITLLIALYVIKVYMDRKTKEVVL